MASQTIKVPDIGEYSNVDVIEIMVAVGDSVEEETPLIALETDKATMEVPAPMAGVVKKITVKEGDKVSEGDVILEVEAAGVASGPDKAEASAVSDPKTEVLAATSGSAPQPVAVPDIGEYSNVDVIEVCVAVGDEIKEEQPLLVLETDKATMEVPSSVAGKVTELKVKEGDKISQGDVILMATVVGGVNESASAKTEHAPVGDKPAADSKPEPSAQPAAVSEPTETVAPSGDVHAGPAVRRFARELGVDLSRVSGSGRKGRLTKEDVQKFVKSVMQGQGGSASAGGASFELLPDPVVDFAKFGEIETQPLSRIKKISGANLARNWVRVPHITFFEDADITGMEAFRKDKKTAAEKAGVKLTPMPFLVKAVAKALLDFPNVNSSLTADGEGQVLKKYVHVGFAVDTPKGLVVPVVRDADKKGLFEIAADMMDLIARGRKGQLKPADMQGGCFTISSLGNIGTTGFAPIVNMPEVGILGVSKAAMKPVFDGKDGFIPRLMLPISLSVDHRVVDGAEAGQFIATVAKYLSDLRELLL